MDTQIENKRLLAFFQHNYYYAEFTWLLWISHRNSYPIEGENISKMYRAPSPNVFAQSYVHRWKFWFLKMSKVCNWNSVHTFAAKSISANLSVFFPVSFFFAFMKRSNRMRIMRRYEFEWTHKMRATKPKCKRENATN